MENPDRTVHWGKRQRIGHLLVESRTAAIVVWPQGVCVRVCLCTSHISLCVAFVVERACVRELRTVKCVKFSHAD